MTKQCTQKLINKNNAKQLDNRLPLQEVQLHNSLVELICQAYLNYSKNFSQLSIQNCFRLRAVCAIN